MKNQKTKFVILGLLTIEPLSGYDIKKLIDTSISHFWSESNGQLYPTLNQLVKESFIVLEEKVQKGKKIRHLYSLTIEGKRELEKWLTETTERKSIQRDEELLKLFFGKNSSSTVSITLLQKREKRVRDKLDQYLVLQKSLEKYSASSHYLYWQLSLQNGIRHAEAELQWCQESINTLRLKG